jgi:hypothetical protein
MTCHNDENIIHAPGYAKWYRHMEDTLTVSYQTKPYFHHRCNNCTPWCLPNGVESWSPHKKSIHGFLFIIAKPWKGPRCSSLGQLINGGTYIGWDITWR